MGLYSGGGIIGNMADSDKRRLELKEEADTLLALSTKLMELVDEYNAADVEYEANYQTIDIERFTKADVALRDTIYQIGRLAEKLERLRRDPIEQEV